MNRPTFLRRSTALLLTLVLMVCAALPGFAAYQMPIQTASDTESVYLFNLDTGKPILRQNSDQQRYIASLTKMMTALLFLESGKDMNAEITIPTSLTQEFKDIQNANGSTTQAGRCFVTFAQQDGHTYGLVILGSNSQNIFREAAELFDWAFTSPELHPAPAEPEVEPEKHGLSAFWHKVFG